MSNKKTIIEIGCAIAILAVASVCVYYCDKVFTPNEQAKPITTTKNKPAQKVATQTEAKDKKITADLYSNTPYDIPLISITEISTLSDDIKKEVNSIIENGQGVYLLNISKNKDKLFIIPQNPTNPNDNFVRHNLEFIEISLKPENYGHKTMHLMGFEGKDGETINAIGNLVTDNETWTLDKDSDIPRPTKHVVYNDKKEVEYTEIWNYNDSNPIKYEMRNAQDKPISIKKETSNNENYTIEHLFYNAEGNIETSLSASYNGANLTRFTFFSNKDGFNSITIITEYENGQKTTEKIYNKAYQHIYTAIATYKDDKMESILLNNNQDEEIIKIYAQ